MKNLNACRAVVIVTNLLMAAGGIVMYLYLPQDADGMLLGISVAMAVLPLVAIAVFLPLSIGLAKAAEASKAEAVEAVVREAKLSPKATSEASTPVYVASPESVKKESEKKTGGLKGSLFSRPDDVLSYAGSVEETASKPPVSPPPTNTGGTIDFSTWKASAKRRCPNCDSDWDPEYVVCPICGGTLV